MKINPPFTFFPRLRPAAWPLLLLLPLVSLPAADPALMDLSLEELMNESVTSVSKKKQRLGDAAAAIAVLTNDDLRRSGATNLADALRVVPGLDVASANASQWAVSARGFNNVYADKLLVLVDGRAVYTPLFAGVYWDLQQTMLEDVDRIEIIRGPGATLWGANAVNGVINVVTASARETHGGLLMGGGGDALRGMGGVRYGGRWGEHSYYRVFGGYRRYAGHPLADGQSARDDLEQQHGGFRIDHYPDPGTQLTWQAEVSRADIDDHASDAYNANTLGRWSRQLSERSGIEIQAYYDRTYRNEATRVRLRADTVDVAAQHTFGLGRSHDIIWGAGFRYIRSQLEQTSVLVAVRNREVDQQLFSAFVQDEFRPGPENLTLTAGIKIEHNDFTGFELQPTLRVVFKPAESQTVWAAVSRAVRTPSQIEGRDVLAVVYGPPFPGPGGALYLPTLVGNADPRSEVLWAWELGYRIRPAQRVSVDLAAFHHNYRDLIIPGGVAGLLPGAPIGTAEIPFANYLRGETWGGEVQVTASPAEAWRLTAGYTLLHARIHGPAEANPQDLEQGSPRHQMVLRSAYDFSARAELAVQFRYVDRIRSVPSYVTADFRFAYRPTEQLELSLVGQNLLDDRHPEQFALPGTSIAEVPRSIHGKLAWRF